MAGAREGEAALPPPLDHQPVEGTAAASKRIRLENHQGVGDEPSFRMEDLPEEIQPVVMSLLPLKEAVRASIVWKSWSMLWRFHSNLCFYGPNGLDNDPHGNGVNDEQSFDIQRAKFIEDVNWVIQRHSGIGINKFSIRCGMHKENSNHIDRWIDFAASSEAKVIEFDLKIFNWSYKKVHHFPLEALGVQGSSFVQSLFLAYVSITPHLGICGFNILRKLVLEYVKIFGDFPGLLANCPALEDLTIIKCSGVANLSIPHQLDKLKHLGIERTNIEIVEFHAADLAHFEYKGPVTPIVLHGCSKLEKATMMLDRKGLGYVFTAVPSISSVKILDVQADIYGYEQLQKLPTRSHYMFTNLRHMTCKLVVRSSEPMADNGVLQVALCLNVAPQLEKLHLDMIHHNRMGWSDEVVEEEEDFLMLRHDHLKTVYIGGFRLYRAQAKLAYCILENAPVLEHMHLEPRCADRISGRASILNMDLEKNLVAQVCEWAQASSLGFGKMVTAPSE